VLVYVTAIASTHGAYPRSDGQAAASAIEFTFDLGNFNRTLFYSTDALIVILSISNTSSAVVYNRVKQTNNTRPFKF